MSTKKVIKLGQELEQKMKADPSVVVTEHPHTSGPAAYMAVSNLKNIIADASELLSLMNEQDVLPQWADETLANAKMNVAKIKAYVRSEKTK